MNIQQQWLLFIILFVVLHQLNTYFLTISKLNRYVAACKHTFYGEANAFLGNVSMLLIFVFLAHLISSSYHGFGLWLLIISGILNLACLALSFYIQYFGTAFSKEGLEMLKNPAYTLLKALPIELAKELIFYYRIILFFPFLALLVFYLISDMPVAMQPVLLVSKIHSGLIILGLIVLLILQKAMFDRLFVRSLAIESAKTTYCLQNLGVYPHYFSPISMVSYTRKLEKILGYKNEEQRMSLYDSINKNKAQYINFLDQKTYSHRLSITEVAPTIQIDPSLLQGDSMQGILKGKKLVLVQVESLNAFLLSLQQTVQERPFLQSFLQECVVMEQFYTSIGIGVSSDAEIAALTGLFPNGKNIVYWHQYDVKKQAYKQTRDMTSLAKYMKEAGYYTQALHGDSGRFYNRKNAYPDILGFDSFYGLEDINNKVVARHLRGSVLYASDYGKRKHVSPWLSDYALAKEAVNHLGRHSKALIYPITMMPHIPFEYNPEPHRLVFKHSDGLFAMTERYLNFTYYYDQFISRYFIDEKGENITDTEAVYLFYGDHGCGLNNKDLEQLLDQSLTHEAERKHLLQIACFLYVPGQEKNAKGLYKGLIKGHQPLVRGQIDIYRTIIELFDLPVKKDFYMGVHLLSQEPTFVMENKVLDTITDQGLFSMRNPNNTDPSSYRVEPRIYQEIRRLKLLNDWLYKDPYLQKDMNAWLNKTK